MAELYGTITTNAYDAAIAQFVAGGPPLLLTELAVGDSSGAYYEPSKTQTALRGEKWRGSCSVSVDPVNNKKIFVTAHIPATVGGFQVREAGVFDENGVMMLVSKQPLSDKVDPGSGASKDMTIRIYAEVVEPGAVEIVVDPSLNFAPLPDFLAHIGNGEIHTSADEKTAIADHIDNAELHVTADEKAGWDGKAAPVQATSATLPASGWAKDTALAFWAQAVEIPGLLAGMRVGIGLTDAQQLDLADAGVNLRIDNDAGVATAKAFGEQPSEDLTLQLFLTEVKL